MQFLNSFSVFFTKRIASLLFNLHDRNYDQAIALIFLFQNLLNLKNKYGIFNAIFEKKKIQNKEKKFSGEIKD